MTLSLLDWIIIGGFLTIIVGVGLSYRTVAGKNLQSFFLGGRNLPWYIAGISMVATTFAADTPLAVTELVGQSGIAGNWLWWSFLAGGMLTTFFFANLWRKANVLTEVELIELRYAGKPASILRGAKAVYLGIFMNAVIIAWVNKALMALLEVFFNLSPNQALVCAGIAMLLVTIYVSASGLLGVAMTDVIQFFVAMIGCIILAVLVVGSDKIGGIPGLKEKVLEKSPNALNFFPSISTGGQGAVGTLGISIAAFFAYAGVQWWASWYPGAEPGGGGYVAQRMMAAKTSKDAVYATLFFQIAHYCIRPWPWILVGLSALVLYPELTPETQKLGYVYAMKEFLPSGLKGLLLVAFFAAYMSTISTQLNWGASYLVNDVYKRFSTPKSDQQLISASRMATLLLMILGLFVTTLIDSISGAWSFIMQCGAGLGLVLILRWYWWRINAWSEISATIAPFVIMGVLSILKASSPEIAAYLDVFPNSFLIIVAATTVIWLLVTFLTPPTDPKVLGKFYKQVEPEGAWSGVRATLGLPKRKSELAKLFGCWLSGIVFTYGMLFLIGKIILQEWKSVGFLSIVVFCSFIALTSLIRKTRIFD